MNNLEANYISLHEAAKLTNYSQDYISLLCRQKKLKGTKIGRNWVTTKEWVQGYINRTKGNGQNVVPVKIKIKKNTPMNDGIPPNMGKLILTAIICSIFVSGFVFAQLGFQGGIIETKPLQVVKGISATSTKGIVSLSNSLDTIKNESVKFAVVAEAELPIGSSASAANEIIGVSNSLNIVKNESDRFVVNKIIIASNTFNDIKSKTVSSLKNLNNKKPDPRVAGVEDSDEDGDIISDEKNDLTNEEMKGLVVVPLEGNIDSRENRELIKNISSSFSDEVDVNPSEDGVSGIINPKNNPEENYLYLMVPVVE